MKDRKVRFLILMTILFLSIGVTVAQEGSYLLETTSDYTLWWSVGTYKVDKSELPSAAKEVAISAAQNEYEPFQLIVRPEEKMENLRIKSSSLSGKNGCIDTTNIKIYDVNYVYVKKSNTGTEVGWYPDPMPLNKGARTLYPRENYPFFIDLYIPSSNTPAGDYTGELTLSWNGGSKTIPYKLTVFDFTLPEKTSLRSSFGLDPQAIKKYHNLQTDEELKQVYDMYLKEMKLNRISPTNLFSLQPMKVDFSGIKWEGGFYDRSKKYEDTYSYKIADASLSQNVYAASNERIQLKPGSEYTLSWDALCKENQEYAVGLRLYDPERGWMIYDNILEICKGDTVWCRDSIKISQLPEEAVEAQIVLYASYPTLEGNALGTTWFDNIEFREEGKTGRKLYKDNFEVDIDRIDVRVDFTEFDKAGERYLDKFGFSAFHLPVQGLGGGTNYSRHYGILSGFEQNSPEYNKLMKRYLSQVEKHLEEKSWLGKEYVYWFDEPGEADYAFVREGMEVLKNAAPKIKRFITEGQPGPEIMDVTDISCTVFNRIKPDVVDSLVRNGKKYWSYLCMSPKPPWVNLFIDQDAINLRMWCWMSYQYKLSGILIWMANYWNSKELSEHGKLQNPWDDPMSYRTGYGNPLGKPGLWGNGDGRFFYPPNRDINNDKQKYMEGPVRSIRLAILREGIEDYEYFVLLQKLRNQLKPHKDKDLIARADSLLHFDETFFTKGDHYTKNPLVLYERRQSIASLIEELTKNIGLPLKSNQ